MCKTNKRGKSAALKKRQLEFTFTTMAKKCSLLAEMLYILKAEFQQLYDYIYFSRRHHSSHAEHSFMKSNISWHAVA